MKIDRLFTQAGKNPFNYFNFVEFSVANPAEPDKVVKITAPDSWSQNAVEILYSKYIRKAGVPVAIQIMFEQDVPQWLCRGQNYYEDKGAVTAGETCARQVIHRIVGHWTYAGWKHGYFGKNELDADAFYAELVYAMCAQMVAPNSPQWFNTGLWWAYGLEGDTINWRWERDLGDVVPRTRARKIQRHEAYRHPQTSACFIQSIGDSLIGPGGILDALKSEASIFKYGSGSGINFSTLRGKGHPLSGGGKSSGLMSFLEVFDKNAGSIKSGGTTRRAAKMVVVDADHPEAMEFVTWKAREEAKVKAMGIGADELVARDGEHRDLYGSTMLTPTSLKVLTLLRDQIENPWEGVAYNTVSGQNSNNSLRVTNEFMEEIANVLEIGLDDEEDATPNSELFDALCTSTWEAGDPGMQFHDACNEWHTIPKVAPQRATNPCSEYSFIDDSSCNLASINLHKFKIGIDNFNAEKFDHLAYLMTIALDITVEMSSYPTAKIAENSWKYRPLGLGYANLGGLLMSMGISYASERGRLLAGAITDLMHSAAWRASTEMADELGAFFDYNEHSFDVLRVRKLHCNANDKLRHSIINADFSDCARNIVLMANQNWKNILMCGDVGIRNAQLTLLAPTGTIGLLMDCDTTGIEPDFALVKHKKRAGGGSMTIVNQRVREGLEALGHQEAAIETYLDCIASGEDPVVRMPPEDAKVFACANDIAWQDHLLMMAAVQPFLSGAISKTVNLPNSATVEDVANCFIMAWKLGLKAVAPYRDGSKGAQPLNVKKKGPSAPLTLDVAGFLKGATAPGHTDLMISPEAIDEALEGVEIPPGFIDAVKDLPELNWPDATVNQSTNSLATMRKKLPAKRRGFTAKAKIEGRSVYLRTGEYDDGTLGEVFLNMDREGTLTSLALNALAISMSMGLQYGVPLDEFVDALKDMCGGPMGSVAGPEEVRFCSSVVDWMARILQASYLTPKIKGGRSSMIIVDDIVHDIDPAAYAPTEALLPVAPKSYDASDPRRYDNWDVEKHGPRNGRMTTGELAGVLERHQKRATYLDETCSNCGEKRLTRNGTCKVCQSCGTTTGCS